MKKENGITLASLAIYVILFIATLAMLAMLSNYIFSKLKDVNNNSISPEEFNKFNAYFVQDVKQSKEASISYDSQTKKTEIILSNGNSYIYSQNEKSIYRNKVKLAKKIVEFTPEIQNIESGGIIKKVISIKISTGDESNPNFTKQIQYVLKYWE